MVDIKALYPDNIENAKQELESIDELIDRVQGLREGVLSSQDEQYTRMMGEDVKTALVIRCLESNGMNGLPESEVINAMFEMIDITAFVIMDAIREEKIRL